MCIFGKKITVEKKAPTPCGTISLDEASSILLDKLEAMGIISYARDTHVPYLDPIKCNIWVGDVAWHRLRINRYNKVLRFMESKQNEIQELRHQIEKMSSDSFTAPNISGY